jgi:hypothetical protein
MRDIDSHFKKHGVSVVDLLLVFPDSTEKQIHEPIGMRTLQDIRPVVSDYISKKCPPGTVIRRLRVKSRSEADCVIWQNTGRFKNSTPTVESRRRRLA